MRFLFTTDGHLSSKRPVARKEKTDEEYIENQLAKREQLFSYANDIHALIVDGGDFFQYWRMDNSYSLLIKLNKLFDKYKVKYLSGIGNHDLPYHSLDNIEQSLMGLMVEMGMVSIKKEHKVGDCAIDIFHYSEQLVEKPTSSAKYKVAVIHENIFESSVPPYMSGYTAQQLAELMPNYDLFLCGHNHQQFVWDNGKQIVVNGGSTMRLTTKQMDYKPAFWEIAIDEDVANPTLRVGNISIVKHEYVIKPDMISLAHLKDNKIETFVESTKDFAEGETFDFRKDVENEMEVRKTIDNVRDIVYDVMEE